MTDFTNYSNEQLEADIADLDATRASAKAAIKARSQELAKRGMQPHIDDAIATLRSAGLSDAEIAQALQRVSPTSVESQEAFGTASTK